VQQDATGIDLAWGYVHIYAHTYHIYYGMLEYGRVNEESRRHRGRLIFELN